MHDWQSNLSSQRLHYICKIGLINFVIICMFARKPVLFLMNRPFDLGLVYDGKSLISSTEIDPGTAARQITAKNLCRTTSYKCLCSPGAIAKRACFVHVQPNTRELYATGGPVFQRLGPPTLRVTSEPVGEDLLSTAEQCLSVELNIVIELTVYPGHTLPTYSVPSGFVMNTFSSAPLI